MKQTEPSRIPTSFKITNPSSTADSLGASKQLGHLRVRICSSELVHGQHRCHVRCSPHAVRARGRRPAVPAPFWSHRLAQCILRQRRGTRGYGEGQPFRSRLKDSFITSVGKFIHLMLLRWIQQVAGGRSTNLPLLLQAMRQNYQSNLDMSFYHNIHSTNQSHWQLVSN